MCINFFKSQLIL